MVLVYHGTNYGAAVKIAGDGAILGFFWMMMERFRKEGDLTGMKSLAARMAKERQEKDSEFVQRASSISVTPDLRLARRYAIDRSLQYGNNPVIFGLDVPLVLLRRYGLHANYSREIGRNSIITDITIDSPEELQRLIPLEYSFFTRASEDQLKNAGAIFVPRGISLRRLKEIHADKPTQENLKGLFSPYNPQYRDL